MWILLALVFTSSGIDTTLLHQGYRTEILCKIDSQKYVASNPDAVLICGQVAGVPNPIVGPNIPR